MTLCEVQFKVGNGQSWLDGQTIQVKPPGVLLSPAEIIDWVQNSNEPDLSALTIWRRREVRLDLQRIKLLTTLNVTQVANRMGASMEEAQRRIDDAQTRRTAILANGYDTNWGHKELQAHGVITCDLEFKHIYDLVFEPEDENADPLLLNQPTWARRLYRVNYQGFAPAPMIANLQNQTIRVEAFRGAPRTASDFQLLTPP